ncbi:hypothetical protein JTI58_19070 [Lysinibacillus fusiformis]|uniref:HNH endonuclease n=1 Tax=Lysinibacillus fusiformis TaxID=28031 RepID=UPI0019670CC0|nr:hypothetical protein [Lysinibacillus fusiformis]QSB09095.1 hypothetical protein JTI58_19070 [Lysinibacillus fusiformis]
MIKLNAIDQKYLDKHLNYFKGKCHPKLQEYLKKPLTIGRKEFLYFLNNNYEEIIIGTPEVLQKIKCKIKNSYKHAYEDLHIDKKNANPNQIELKNIINDIFDYDNFQKVKKTMWDAYQLTKALNVTICPYCNRSFTTTHLGEDGKTRPTLDHFYNKSKYPYFALSIYNLIPSCYVCNSSFKGDKDFSIDSHLHPYIEGFENHANFTLILDENDPKNLLLGNFEIKLNIEQGSQYKDKILNNEKVFHLTELYDSHHDYIYELINQSVMYSDSNIKQLTSLPLFENESEIRNMLLGFNGDVNVNSSNKVLSKLMKDISDELGLSIT